MAFLVCFSERPEDHTKERAAYLSQQFYELIHEFCHSGSRDTVVLKDIADLGYKSPTLALSDQQIHGLLDDLRLLEQATSHEEVTLLRRTVSEALSRGCLLTISGDMHLELGDEAI